MPEADTQTQTRGRALALLLAYAVLSAPGAFSAVRGCDAASRGTLEKVNEEKARRVAELQGRLEGLRRDLDRLAEASERRSERLRGELRGDLDRLSRAVLELALRRRVRAPLRRSLEREDAPAPLPALPRATRLPRLRPPEASLEALEQRAAAAK